MILINLSYWTIFVLFILFCIIVSISQWLVQYFLNNFRSSTFRKKILFAIEILKKNVGWKGLNRLAMNFGFLLTANIDSIEDPCCLPFYVCDNHDWCFKIITLLLALVKLKSNSYFILSLIIHFDHLTSNGFVNSVAPIDPTPPSKKSVTSITKLDNSVQCTVTIFKTRDDLKFHNMWNWIKTSHRTGN